jgi:hypothetical protein
MTARRQPLIIFPHGAGSNRRFFCFPTIRGHLIGHERQIKKLSVTDWKANAPGKLPGASVCVGGN